MEKLKGSGLIKACPRLIDIPWRPEKDILPVTKMVTSEDLIESIFARHEAPLPSKISISSPSFFLKTFTK